MRFARPASPGYTRPRTSISTGSWARSRICSPSAPRRPRLRPRNGRASVAGTPRTRYAHSGDAHIAYQAFGEGQVDLVFVPGFVSNIEHYWEMPKVPELLDR